jgi:hypothetical protein
VKEEPVFSGGVVKLLLVLVVAAGLGFGAYALAGGGIDLPDLPDLPEINTDSTSDVTNLENTTLEDTTLEETSPDEAADPFTSAGFGQALAAVEREVGNAELTQITINDTQTQFIVRRGDGVEAYDVRSDNGELVHQNATITISGNATLADFTFPLKGVQASSIDRMLSGARKLSGAQDFRATVLSLERAIPFGSRALEWTINGQGNDRYLTYRADADGSDIHDLGGGGAKIPEAAKRAQQLNDCIKAAGQNPEAIFNCLDRFQ